MSACRPPANRQAHRGIGEGRGRWTARIRVWPPARPQSHAHARDTGVPPLDHVAGTETEGEARAAVKDLAALAQAPLVGDRDLLAHACKRPQADVRVLDLQQQQQGEQRAESRAETPRLSQLHQHWP